MMADTRNRPQNFDLASLKNITLDLGKIDLNNLRAALSRRVDVLIDLALIAATIFAVRYLFTTTDARMNTIKNDLAQFEEKSQTIIEYEKQKKKLDAFLETLPQGFATSTEIIKKVIGLAEDHNVNVVFYTPTQAGDEALHATQTVSFTFESSYGQMLDLLHAIEQNSKNLRLNSWKKEAGQDKNIIRWGISVSSITLHDEI